MSARAAGWFTRPARGDVRSGTYRAAQTWGLPFLVTLVADWLGWAGLRFWSTGSPWLYPEIALSTLFWVYTARLAQRRSAVIPLILGALAGTYLGLRWP